MSIYSGDAREAILRECARAVETICDARVTYLAYEDAFGFEISKRVVVFTITTSVLLSEDDSSVGVVTRGMGDTNFREFEKPATEGDSCRVAQEIVGLANKMLESDARGIGALLGGSK